MPWSAGISYSIEINAPVERVWNYLSDSDKARDWSVYFSHIRDLSTGGKQLPGDIRRCYRDEEERTLSWDEVVLSLEPNQERIIYTFNLLNYWPKVITQSTAYFVRQRYEQIGPDRTKLSFDSIIDPQNASINRLLFYLAKGEAKEIFVKNLENIKSLIEGRPAPNPYEPFPRKFAEKIFSDF